MVSIPFLRRKSPPVNPLEQEIPTSFLDSRHDEETQKQESPPIPDDAYTAEEVRSGLKSPWECSMEAQMILAHVDEKELYGTDVGRDMIGAATAYAILSYPMMWPHPHQGK